MSRTAGLESWLIGEPVVPPWSHFCELAGRGPVDAWCRTGAPSGIRLGESVVGRGKKDLILGTKCTLGPEVSGDRSPDKAHEVLPSGIFIGTCKSLLDHWGRIESSILSEWGISNDPGAWHAQRSFYRFLNQEHFKDRHDCPGLIWAVPYWIRTANKWIEPQLGDIDITTRFLQGGKNFAFGTKNRREILIPPGLLKGFEFEIAKGEEPRDFAPAIVYRDRLYADGRPYIRDNFILAGRVGDEGLESQGINRATMDLYAEIDGWKLNGAWIILLAAFRGDRHGCSEVSYTHRVIDPFTKRTHGIGRIRTSYESFWRSSYGRIEALATVMPYLKYHLYN